MKIEHFKTSSKIKYNIYLIRNHMNASEVTHTG